MDGQIHQDGGHDACENHSKNLWKQAGLLVCHDASSLGRAMTIFSCRKKTANGIPAHAGRLGPEADFPWVNENS
jgi:hypothetical protein